MSNPNDTLEATSALNAARTRASEAAWPAVQAMLGTLKLAMAGERLRGMANLATSTNPYRALLVRARRADKGLAFPKHRGGNGWGNEVLVLREDGQLFFAMRNDVGDIHERFVDASDLKAEDVEHVAETITDACQRHMGAADRATQQYNDLFALSERLRAALEGP